MLAQTVVPSSYIVFSSVIHQTVKVANKCEVKKYINIKQMVGAHKGPGIDFATKSVFKIYLHLNEKS